MVQKIREALAVVGALTIVASIVAAAVLVGECNAFRRETKIETAPVVAPPTKIEERAEPIVLPCRDVQAISPKPKDRKRIAEKYHRPDLAADANRLAVDGFMRSAQILGERTIPRAPEGGTALLTLEPDGRVEMTVTPEPEKLFDWRARWELGGLYGVGTAGDTRGRAWAAVEPLRFARLHLRVEAGADLRSGQTDGYVMAGVVWRSR